MSTGFVLKTAGGIRTSFMWQIGHVPGTADRTSGCIVHQYLASPVGPRAGGLTLVGLWAGRLSRVGQRGASLVGHRARAATLVGLSGRLTIVGPSHNPSPKPNARSHAALCPTREAPPCPTGGRGIFTCRHPCCRR